MSILEMSELTNTMNKIIIERKYTQNALNDCIAKGDHDMVPWYKGKMIVQDAYIRTIEEILEEGG